jgi:hypothetical protein
VPPPAALPRPLLGRFSAESSRWPLVADDLFRVAHNDWGKPLLHRDVAGLGLGAAVLAELLLARYATVHDGALIPVVPADPADPADPVDPLAATVLRQIRAEPHELALRNWLAFLAGTAPSGGDVYEQVARRLARAGHVRAEPRGLLRRSVRYVPGDMNTAAWPWARVSQALEHGHHLDAFDTMLVGLILATDLHRRVMVGDAGHIEAQLRRNVDEAPLEVRELLYHTETAVGATVITGS